MNIPIQRKSEIRFPTRVLQRKEHTSRLEDKDALKCRDYLQQTAFFNDLPIGEKINYDGRKPTPLTARLKMRPAVFPFPRTPIHQVNAFDDLFNRKAAPSSTQGAFISDPSYSNRFPAHHSSEWWQIEDYGPIRDAIPARPAPVIIQGLDDNYDWVEELNEEEQVEEEEPEEDLISLFGGVDLTLDEDINQLVMLSSDVPLQEMEEMKKMEEEEMDETEEEAPKDDEGQLGDHRGDASSIMDNEEDNENQEKKDDAATDSDNEEKDDEKQKKDDFTLEEKEPMAEDLTKGATEVEHAGDEGKKIQSRTERYTKDLKSDDVGNLFIDFPQLAVNTDLLLSDFASVLGKSVPELIAENDELWEAIDSIEDKTERRRRRGAIEESGEEENDQSGTRDEGRRVIDDVQRLNRLQGYFGGETGRIDKLIRNLQVSSPSEAVKVLSEAGENRPLLFSVRSDPQMHLYLVERSVPIIGGLRLALLSLVAASFLLNLKFVKEARYVACFFYIAVDPHKKVMSIPRIPSEVRIALETAGVLPRQRKRALPPNNQPVPEANSKRKK